MSDEYEQQQGIENEGLSFEDADPVQSIHEEARYDSPTGIVHPTGRTPINMGATLIFDRLADEAGYERDQYCVRLGANVAAGVASAHVVKPDAPKAMPFRRNADGTITLYLHGVFKDFPDLRPAGRRACRVTPTTDKKGAPCVIINLRGGFVKATAKRSDGAQ